MLDEINKLLMFQREIRALNLGRVKKTPKRTQVEEAMRIFGKRLGDIECAPALMTHLQGMIIEFQQLTSKEIFPRLKAAALRVTWLALEALVEEAMMLEFSNTVEAFKAEALAAAQMPWTSSCLEEQLALLQKIQRARGYETAFAGFRALNK